MCSYLSHYGKSLILAFSVLLVVLMYWLGRTWPYSSTGSRQPVSLQLREAIGKLPLSFEAARGPTDNPVTFIARGNGYNLSLKPTEATILLRVGSPKEKSSQSRLAVNSAQFRKHYSSESVIQSVALKMKLVNASPAPQITGVDEMPGKTSHFIGNDPTQWRTRVPLYAKVRYQSVYEGVDLIFYGNQQQLEYDFIVAPGADPRQIRFQFAGADKVEIEAAGDLLLHIADGQVRQHKPVIYQEENGIRREVSGGYVINDEGQVGFQIGNYDPHRALVIDPTLIYSTYMGGSEDFSFEGFPLGDFGSDIAVDAAGNAYVTGTTFGADFPTEKPLQNKPGSTDYEDVFVLKLNTTGALVYSTFLGGSLWDTGASIAVDSAGNAYLTGSTDSSNFPTVNPFQATHKNYDAFVAKLNADGSALVYSTFFGGSGIESGTGIAVDSEGSAYITGTTFGASDLPLEKPLQASYNGGTCLFLGDPFPCPDAFVAKLNAAGSALVFSTYLGGSGFDLGNSIAVDATGQVYVAGATASPNFPVRNAIQNSLAGGSCQYFGFCVDSFVSKITADGSAFVYSTYLGGGQAAVLTGSVGPYDMALGIAADANGNAYVTGATGSRDFPLKNAIRTSISGTGETDAFVTKFDPAGALVYSTFLGGDENENDDNFFLAFFSIIGNAYSSNSVAIDAAGNAYVTGRTRSSNFPVLNPLSGSLRGESDAFVSKLDPAGTLVWSTYFGGNNHEEGFGIAVDATGGVYITGVTESTDFPLANAQQGILKGDSDLFISKLIEGSINSTPITTVSAASYDGRALSSESIGSAFGTNLATTTQSATATPLPTTLGGTTVSVRDTAGTERLAPLFYVSPLQVNYQIPFGTVVGEATITIMSGDGMTSSGKVQIATIAPGVFASNQKGYGYAAANIVYVSGTNQRYEPNTVIDLTAADEVFVELYGTGIRNHSGLANVSVTVGGTPVPVTYASLQPSFIGLDQVNIKLLRSLAGRGEVDVVLTVDGKAANPVKIYLR